MIFIHYISLYLQYTDIYGANIIKRNETGKLSRDYFLSYNYFFSKVSWIFKLFFLSLPQIKTEKGMKEKKTTLVGWRPANEEEAITRIEAIEADIEKNGLIDEEEMIEHLKAKGLWLI